MENDDFITEDFKLKLDYLIGQYSRLGQRLGFFLTLETAIFGLYGWLAFEKHSTDVLWLPCIVGAVISFLWYLVAAQDRWLVVQYRNRVNEAAKLVGKTKGLTDYEHRHPGNSAASGFDSLFCWYCRPLSISTLPTWASLFLIIVWGILLIAQPHTEGQ